MNAGGRKRIKNTEEGAEEKKHKREVLFLQQTSRRGGETVREREEKASAVAESELTLKAAAR